MLSGRHCRITSSMAPVWYSAELCEVTRSDSRVVRGSIQGDQSSARSSCSSRGKLSARNLNALTRMRVALRRNMFAA